MANIPFSAVYNHIYSEKKEKIAYTIQSNEYVYGIYASKQFFVAHYKNKGGLEDQMAGRKKRTKQIKIHEKAFDTFLKEYSN